MTVMEIIIVTAIIALVTSGMVVGIGALTRQRLKSSAVGVVAAVRAAYSHAATSGRTVRIVFDFESRSLWMEDAEPGNVLLDREDAQQEEEAEDEAAGEAARDEPSGSGAVVQAEELSKILGDDPESLLGVARGAAEADLGSSVDMGLLSSLSAAEVGDLETPRYRLPRFSKLSGPLGKQRTLQGGVEFAKIYVEHRETPVEEGTAYLYFFPSGMTELAVIQLQDGGGVVNSVEVHPLTGRATIHDVPYEPPSVEEEMNEAEEAP